MWVISRAIFYVKKSLKGDDFLSQLSLTETELLAELDGKSVAIIGNSRGLSAGEFGGEIDQHDVVIRLNDAPIPTSKSHGSRTDWLAVAKRISDKSLLARQPNVLLWMPTKRKRLNWMMTRFGKFFLNGTKNNQTLAAGLQAPPTVGLMVIDLVQRSNAREVALYGFDFFASRSLSGNRTKSQVPHDFQAEQQAVNIILENDPRFRLT